MTSQWITPPGDQGQAQLTASTGLEIQDLGRWRFSQAGYNDGATFGLSLGWPAGAESAQDFYWGPRDRQPPPQSGGELSLRAQDWSVATIGNQLTSWTDPATGITWGLERCQILVQGRWQVQRLPNSNSFVSIGISWQGITDTDTGGREMYPWLLDYVGPMRQYLRQGAATPGGAQDTLTTHVLHCRCTEITTSDNSNHEYQSNTLCRPVWAYSWQRRWWVDT